MVSGAPLLSFVISDGTSSSYCGEQGGWEAILRSVALVARSSLRGALALSELQPHPAARPRLQGIPEVSLTPSPCLILAQQKAIKEVWGSAVQRLSPVGPREGTAV